MAAQSLLAKLGCRLGTLGTSGSLAFAYPTAEGAVGMDAHTAANRNGTYSVVGTSVGHVVNGVEVLTVGAATITANVPLGTPASVVGAAGLNIGQGVAPTVPNNGDVWITSAGMYCRAGGSTAGPFGTGDIGGSIANTQVAIGTGANTIGGSAALTVVGGVLTTTNNTDATALGTGALVLSAGGLSVNNQIRLGGILTSTNTTSATTSLLGAVVIGNGTAATSIGMGAGNINAGGTLTVGGVAALTAGTASSAYTNGTLVITGGLGVSGTINTNGVIQAGTAISAGTSINAGTTLSTTNGSITANNTGGLGTLNLTGTTGSLIIFTNTGEIVSTTSFPLYFIDEVPGDGPWTVFQYAAGTIATGQFNFKGTLSATTSLVGAVVIGNGTAATSVAIGGGKANIGGTLAVAGACTLDTGASGSSFGGKLTVTGNFACNGSSAVAQPTGYGTPTGGALVSSFAAGSITTAQVAAELAQLVIDLKKSGIIGA